MGWDNRQYYREDRYGGGGGGFGSRLNGHSVVTWLLGINAIVFLLNSVLAGGHRTQAIAPEIWGNFNVEQGIYGLQLWRVVTYQFLHANLMHIIFNMIGLYFFGPMMEQWWGSRRFIAFYLLCGVSGAILMTVLGFVPGLLLVSTQTPLVGASGAIFGILIGAARVAPNQRVMLLFPPIPMQLRTMAWFFLGMSALGLLAGNNAGGEAAHLGGALLGFLLVSNPRVLNWADRGSMPTLRSLSDKRKKYSQHKQKQSEAATQAEVDRILDKVRDQGLHSLSAKEKKILQQETDRKQAG